VTLGYSGVACGKAASEDFFDAARPSPRDLVRHGLVLALADGVSGSGSGGRRAAETCVRSVVSDFYATPANWAVAHSFDRIIGAVNDWLFTHNLRTAEPGTMLSTLSVLVLHGAACHIAHVGDTRVYRQRGRHLECLTTDHVWPRRDMRHVLRRAVGLDRHLAVDCSTDTLEVGDLFLMLSDGVWEVLGDSGIRAVLAGNGDPAALARALATGAAEKQRGYYGRNDATAAAIRITRLPVEG